MPRHRSLRIPFSEAALHANLSRLEHAWETSQTSRHRDAIYSYLDAVFELGTWWQTEGSDRRNAGRALRLRGHRRLLQTPEPFAALIMSTSNADEKTRSKWSRVLRYADEYKDQSEPLQDFIKRKGGINKCATRYARRLGRHKPRLFVLARP